MLSLINIESIFASLGPCIVFSSYLVFNFIFKMSSLKCKHKSSQINLGCLCVCLCVNFASSCEERSENRIEKKKTKTCESWSHQCNFYLLYMHSKVWFEPADKFLLFEIQSEWTAGRTEWLSARLLFMIYFYCNHFMIQPVWISSFKSLNHVYCHLHFIIQFAYWFSIKTAIDLHYLALFFPFKSKS